METLKRYKPDLIRWLRCTDRMILQYVDSRSLITNDDYYKLKSIRDVDERNTELLDMITARGQTTCVQFLNLLKMKEVNESSPELKEWIDKVNISGPPEASSTGAANDPRSTTSHAGNQRITDNQKFLEQNRCALIEKVKNVVNIVDGLRLTSEMEANVKAEPTDQARMRKVLEYTNSKIAAECLIQALWKYAGDVMDDLTHA